MITRVVAVLWSRIVVYCPSSFEQQFHSVHHAHPSVPWYALPRLFASKRDRFLAMNDGYHFGCYGEVIRKFAIKRKDPVAHPNWSQKPLIDTVIVSKICWLFPAKSGRVPIWNCGFLRPSQRRFFKTCVLCCKRYLARPA